ncbi:FMN adenylyltransferase [Desulfitobacterium dehalogenans ATCC 51507]|uniref:Riboflavin biosynthesis protein n=1 Tax=Desulfitobacterium dehalogenans (strain ATCC 51507 / DSM 9161 / JW/IU-DC1) TaxID=756499 RepID=I4ABN8_DESDJ|nr:bifunctional riboflavin kinase/FAD synthetase [Desulfitobacterium dehalogenans]AFM01373.1 FMN adenylyltransferase [Desulfitobacterium dehalogenans ATCC 51507]
MQIIRELPSTPETQCVLALGNFDGVHLGHQRLLKSGLEQAAQKGVDLAVLLFEPHPLKLLFPERVIGFLTTQKEQMRLFSEIGVDRVYLVPFTKEMADTSPEGFVRDILVKLGVVHIVVGFNYSFGALGKGTAEDLQRYGQDYGFGVSVLQPQTFEGKVISSTAVRKALLNGDAVQAKKLLGRTYKLVGTVVEGEKRGHDLGYPTANLRIYEDLIIPKRGVYAVWAEIEGRLVHGMMNIGMKPTFHEEYALTVEIHFFDFSGDLYGMELAICCEEKIRDERKFNGLGELKGQLDRDALKVKQVLEGIFRNPIQAVNGH